VCPTGYDLGEHFKIVMLCVTEGEDKPLKYPSIFVKSELMILSKVDLLPYVPFDAELAKSHARMVHPGIEIIETSNRGDGMEQWMIWLEEKLAAVKSGELVSA
jgi:hydrogenase nickel incorporation protein HypB